jgi:hypothetical protein
VEQLQHRFPDFAFSELADGNANSGVGRLQWGFGPAGEPRKITGIDVFWSHLMTVGSLPSTHLRTQLRGDLFLEIESIENDTRKQSTESEPGWGRGEWRAVAYAC